jgi:hypothetical protein
MQSTRKWFFQFQEHSSKLESTQIRSSQAQHHRQRHRLPTKQKLNKASNSSHTNQRENPTAYNQACFSASPSVTSVLGQKWLKSPTGKSMPNLISAAIMTNVMYQLHGKKCSCQRMGSDGRSESVHHTHPNIATINNKAPPA